MMGEGSLFLRSADHRWVAQVSHGSGPNRRVVRRVARTRAEAKRLLDDLLLSVPGGRVDPKMTVGTYLRSWLEGAGRDVLKPSTWTTYEIAVRRHLLPSLEGVPLSRLRPEHVEAMLAGIAASPKGRRNILNVLSRILAVAERRGLIARNPVALVERPRLPRLNRAALTVVQARTLLDLIRGDRLEVLYLVTLLCGLRQAEVLGLRWEDIDLETGVLHVVYTLDRRGGEYVLDDPKTKSSRRTIVLPAFAVERLREHRRTQLAERIAAGTPSEEGLVFLTPSGRPINQGWLTKRWRVLSRSGGLDLRFHDLRHGQASLLVALGVHPRVVAERLGHASSVMSMDRYAHVARGQDVEAARLLDEALRPAVSAEASAE